jgi:hypothetical protein
MVNKSTGINPKDEREEFGYILEVLRNQLLSVSTCIYIYEQLFPTEKVVDIINRYKGFFRPTSSALIDSLIVRVSTILSRQATAPSFYCILNMIGKDPYLAPNINVHEIKKRLRKHVKTLKAIEDFRNKRVAHWDTSVENQEVGKPLLLDAERMVEALEAIFNEISASHSNNEWSFKYVQQGDIISLLDALKWKQAYDKKLVEYWQSKINHESEGQNCRG